MMYELGSLDTQYNDAMEEIAYALSSLESIETKNGYHSMLEGISVEVGKFDITVAYIERIYTTIMKIVYGVIKFVKRMWLRISLGVKSDEERDELIAKLKTNKKFDIKYTKELKKFVGKNLAYFFTKDIEGTTFAKDVNGILKESVSLRKGMLDGDILELDLPRDITQSTIGKDFVFNKDMSEYNEDLTFLGVNGMNVYLLASTKKDPNFGSGYRVVSAILNKSPRWNAKDMIKKTISAENSLKELSDMMDIGNLYNVLTKGIFEEMEAISHDLESDRLRMLKKARSITAGTLDDIKVHGANVRAKSKSARTLVGMSKALMHIGNGMIHDRKMRLKTARLIAKQIGE